MKNRVNAAHRRPSFMERWTATVALALSQFATPGSALAGRIVYLAEQEVAFRSELYLVDTAMPGKTTRLNGPSGPISTGVGNFAVSPDGGRLVFTADQDTPGDTDLFLVDLTALGSWTRVGSLAPGKQELFAKFSPDGRKVAFTAGDETFGNVQLYLVDLAAPSAALRLNGDLVEHGSVSMTGFDFTPDGGRIVYVASELDRIFELYTVNLAEPGRSTRLNGPGGSVGDSFEGRFSILADSTAVVYSAVAERPGVRELHLVEFAAPQPVTLNAALQDDGDIAGFSVSPDGRWVAYVADQETEAKQEVFLVDLASPGVATRVNGPVQTGAGLPGFTVDSRFVIYSGDEERGPGQRDLYRVAVEQPADRARVNNSPADGADVFRYTLSEDGELLAYLPESPDGFLRDLMVVDLGAAGSDLRVNGPLPDGALEFSLPRFGPDGDSIAFVAVESLDDSVAELFFARLSVPGTSVRLNAALPADALVAARPDSFAWLPANAPPTGAPPVADPTDSTDSTGGGGPLGPAALLVLVSALVSRRLRLPGAQSGPRIWAANGSAL